MANLKIVGFAGSSSRPSRTRNLVEAIALAAARQVPADVSVYDLTEIHPSLGSTLDPRHAPQDLQQLIAEITAADALVVGSPVYKGTYTGLFKHLFDLIEPKALKDKPVVLRSLVVPASPSTLRGMEALKRSACRRSCGEPSGTAIVRPGWGMAFSCGTQRPYR